MIRDFFLLSAVLILSFNTQAQWINIGSAPQQSFKKMSFPTERHGYALSEKNTQGGHYIFKTFDGGRNWSEVQLDPSLFNQTNLQAISFLSASTGMIMLLKGRSVKIYKTTNYAKTWVDVTPDSMKYITGGMDIKYVHHARVHACTGNRLFTSTDGGKTWTFERLTPYKNLTEINFANDKRGIIGYWDGTFLYSGGVYYTIDGGKNYDTLNLNYYQSSVHNVWATRNGFFALTSYRFRRGQTLYRSFNDGQSWDSLALNFMVDSFDIAQDFLFENDSTAYLITGEGAIYKTTDTANTWKLVHKETYGLYNIAKSNINVFASGNINTLVAKFEPLSDSLHCDRYKILNLKDSVNLGNNGVYFEMTVDTNVRFNTGYTDMYFLNQGNDTINQYNLWGSYIPTAGDTIKYFFNYINNHTFFPKNFNGHLIMQNPQCYIPYNHLKSGIHEFKPSIKVAVYPNPSSEIIQIKNEHSFTRATVITMKGKRFNLPVRNNTLRITELPRGNYLLILSDRIGKTYSARFVKQ